MTRYKAAAVGALTAVLAVASITPALANGNGYRHGHGHGYYYGNPLYPIVALAGAVVGTAAAIVTLPFQIIGAAAAHAPGYYAPQPQGYAAPGYGAPQAYYPAPAPSYYAPPTASYYAPPAPYYAPRAAGYDGYRGYNGQAANAGYQRPYGPPNGGRYDGPSGGNYAPQPTPHGSPNGYYPPDQRSYAYEYNTR